MSTRSVIVRLEAEVAGYVAGMGRAATATDSVARQVVNARRSMDNNRQAMDTAGKTMLGFGTTSVAALGASAKAAMDWESAWAGVTKTVDGSPEQMAELETGLRNLAKTLPATHQEIAAVAEAAGQLGVKREDVLGFTEQMIALGETTNLTADEAATSIAQISNVMGTMARDGSEGVERFSATLVALGNAGASTEKEILEMAKRLAGAGALIGASESDVLAMANAMASVGIEAQLGGGVMSRVMQRMYTDVMNGGKGLDALAKTAGVSSKDFAAAFESDPVRAVDMMVQGLARVKAEGGNVMETMDGLGIKGTEETSVILRLAGAGNLLADSLKLGDEAWASNSALAAEAAKRYETTESKVKVAWNNIKDAAIDAGASILPVIVKVAEVVSGLAQTFGDLPEPVQGAVTGFAAVVGGAAILGGAVLTLVPRIAETRQAFADLNSSGSRVPGMLGKVAKAAGIAAGAFVAFEVVKGLHNSMQPAAKSLEEFTQALVGLDKESSALDNLFKDIGAKEFEGSISNAGEALNKVLNQDFNASVESFGATVLGLDNGMAKIGDAFTKADQAIASAASSGNLETAAAGFKSIAESADAQGISLDKVGGRFPEYLDSLRSLASNAKVSLTEQELLNWAMGETPAAMQAAAAGADGAAGAITAVGDASSGATPLTEEIADALADLGVDANGAVVEIVKFTDALINAGLLNLSARDAARGFEEALDAVTESVKTNGTTLDITTEKGRANQAALDAVAGAGYRVAQANAAHGGTEKQLQADLQKTYDGLITAAGGMGITGDAAHNTARKIMEIPPNVSVQSWMSSEAKAMAQQTTGELNAVDGRVVSATINTYKNFYETTFQKVVRELSGGAAPVGAGTVLRAPERASGGDLDMAPGPKGVDSQLFWGAKGEHVFTDREVDLMGGQQAVYKFRSDLRAGNIQGFQNGGGIGTRAAATQLMAHTAAAAPRFSGPMEMVGTLELNADATMATFRGMARHEANGAVAAADAQSQYTRRG